MTTRLFMFCAAWFALGCGTTPATDAGPDVTPDGGTDEVAVYFFGGVYFVPDRTDVSTYPVAESTWTQRGDRVGLFYNLPRMLVGNSVGVAMSGTLDPATPGEVALSGPLGTATCELDAAGLPTSCLERFDPLDVDLERVRREAERDDPARVEERVTVATQFRDDPIGVIEAERGLLGPIDLPLCFGPEDCPDTRCDIDGPEGYCEPPSDGLIEGQACDLDHQCAAGLECGTDRVCEPR